MASLPLIGVLVIAAAYTFYEARGKSSKQQASKAVVGVGSLSIAVALWLDAPALVIVGLAVLMAVSEIIVGRLSFTEAAHR